MSMPNRSILSPAAPHAETCRCAEPLPVVRAERKGAAVTVCRRCGSRIPVRLR
jgi:hypothetical protein